MDRHRIVLLPMAIMLVGALILVQNTVTPAAKPGSSPKIPTAHATVTGARSDRIAR